MKKAVCHYDANALRENASNIRRQITAPHMLAVVKANAYGHGLGFAVNALHDIVDGFAVDSMHCAEIIRATLGDNAIPIMLLAGTADENETRRAAELKLWLVIHEARQIAWLMQLPHSAAVGAWVKTNSGMNRLGFSVADAAAVMEQLMKMPQVARVGLMSHFACADMENGLDDALLQLQPLREKADMISLGNSAASLLHPNIGDEWARIGIALYGSSPAPILKSRESLGLRAVMTLQAPLIAVQNLQRGDAVGYAATWRATQPVRIGVVACGYSRGYPQNNQSWKCLPWALVEKQRAEVVGRPSMEMLTLDISHCAAADVGSAAVLWGDSPSIDEVATACNRLSYDLLCAAGHGGERQTNTNH